MISVDKDSKLPMYQQIYEALKQVIIKGNWKPGEKLPSIRMLCADLMVARNTVDYAYRQLCVEGYAEGKQGLGYVVSDISRDILQMDPVALSYSEPRKTEIEPEIPDRLWSYDFLYHDLRAGTFPAEIWRKLTNDALFSSNDAKLTAYNRKRGEYGLRQEISRYLERSRGVDCLPEQIVITSGTQQSLIKLMQLFDSSQHVVAMENPGYDGSRIVFSDSGFSVLPVSTTEGSSQ